MKGLWRVLLLFIIPCIAVELSWEIGDNSGCSQWKLCQFYASRSGVEDPIVLAVSILASATNGHLSGGTVAPGQSQVEQDPSLQCGSFATFHWMVVPTGEQDCTQVSPDFRIDADVAEGSWFCSVPGGQQTNYTKLLVLQLAVQEGFDVGVNLRVVQSTSIITDAQLICGPPGSPIVLPPLPSAAPTSVVGTSAAPITDSPTSAPATSSPTIAPTAATSSPTIAPTAATTTTTTTTSTTTITTTTTASPPTTDSPTTSASTTTPPPSSSSLLYLIGVVVAVLVLLAVIIVGVWLFVRWWKQKRLARPRSPQKAKPVVAHNPDTIDGEEVVDIHLDDDLL